MSSEDDALLLASDYEAQCMSMGASVILLAQEAVPSEAHMESLKTRNPPVVMITRKISAVSYVANAEFYWSSLICCNQAHSIRAVGGWVLLLNKVSISFQPTSILCSSLPS